MTFICYSKCSTCKKAQKYLDSKGIDYTFREIKEDNPTEEELKKWLEMSDYDIKRFFNTSGQLYRSLGLKDRLASMTEHEKIALLATDGMLVKRPILVADDDVLVGFKQAEWDEKLSR